MSIFTAITSIFKTNVKKFVKNNKTEVLAVIDPLLEKSAGTVADKIKTGAAAKGITIDDDTATLVAASVLSAVEAKVSTEIDNL